MLAAKEAFNALFAGLMWEGPAGAHGPLAREKSQRSVRPGEVDDAVPGPRSDRQWAEQEMLCGRAKAEA